MTDPRQQELLNTASRLRELGRIPEAIDAYKALLSAFPALPESWYNLGWLLRQAGQPDEALSAYDEALRRGVGGPEEVHLNRAVIFSDALGRPAEAKAALDQALAIEPEYLPALINLGNLHEDLGHRDAAAATYQRAHELYPDNAIVLSRLAGLSRTSSPGDPVQTKIKALLAGGRLLAADRALLLFALGRLQDLAGTYDEAAKTFEAANDAARFASGGRVAPYNGLSELARADRLLQAFMTTRDRRTGIDAPVPAPVFILGMFRSGSTLVEQVLGAHSQVGTGGELDMVPRIALGLGNNPEASAGASDAQYREYAEAYLSRMRRQFPDARIVTDKRPDNFWHVGLIKRLFPAAKIINTLRHPIDTLVSVWGLFLDTTLNYSFSVEDIAAHIHAERRMMANWNHLFPGDILTLRYEDLVRTPEAEIRRMLDFLDLPFETACLEFHKTASAVRTASVWQVREPLNDRSIGRWRHYERYLRSRPPHPALEALFTLEASGKPA